MSQRFSASPNSSPYTLLSGQSTHAHTSGSAEDSVNHFIDAEKKLSKWESDNGLSVIENNPNYHFLLNRDHNSMQVNPKQMKYVTEVAPLGYFDTRADTSATTRILHGNINPAPLRSAVTDANNIFPPTLNVQLPSVVEEKVELPLPDLNLVAATNSKLVDNVMARSQVLPLRLEVQRLTKTNIALHTHLMEALAKQEHNETHYQQQLKELTQVHQDLKFVHGQQDRRIQELNMTIATLQDKMQQVLLAKSPQMEQTFDLTSVLTTGNVNTKPEMSTGGNAQQERVILILKNAQSHINNLTQEISALKENRLVEETNVIALTRKNELQIAEIERLSALLGNNVNWDKIHVETELSQNARMIEKLQRQVDILNEERVNSMKAISRLGASAVAAVANAGGYTTSSVRGRSSSRGRGSRSRDNSTEYNHRDTAPAAVVKEEVRLNPKKNQNLHNSSSNSSTAQERKLQSQVSSLTNEVRVQRQGIQEKEKLKRRVDQQAEERKQMQQESKGRQVEHASAETALQQQTEQYNEEKEYFEQEKQKLVDRVHSLEQEQDKVYEVCSEELAQQQRDLVEKYQTELDQLQSRLQNNGDEAQTLAYEHAQLKTEHKQQRDVCVTAMHQIEQLQQAQRLVNEELKRCKLEKIVHSNKDNVQAQLELEQGVSRALQNQLSTAQNNLHALQRKMDIMQQSSARSDMNEASLKHQVEYLMSQEQERKASTDALHQEIQRLTEQLMKKDMYDQYLQSVGSGK